MQASSDTLSFSYGPCGGTDSVQYYLKNPLLRPVTVYVAPEHDPNDTLHVLRFHFDSPNGDFNIGSVMNMVAPVRNQLDLSSYNFNFPVYLPDVFRDRDLILFSVFYVSYYLHDSLTVHLAELRQFVEKGGTVIFTGGYDINNLIAGTGLLDESYGQNSLSWSQPLQSPVPNDPILEFVNSSVLRSTYYTYAFDDTSSNWQQVVTWQGKGIVGYKPIGKGRVIFIGFDYDSPNQEQEEILANAIRSSSHAWIRSTYLPQVIPANDSVPVYFSSSLNETSFSGDIYSRFSILSSDTAFQTDTVIVHAYIDPRPCVVYTLQNFPCQRVCIANNSTHAPDSLVIDYGDGTVLDSVACHDYTHIGSYPVSFTACNAYGCSKITDTISIQAIGPVDAFPYQFNWASGLSELREVDLNTIQNTSSPGRFQDFSCDVQTNLVEGRYYPVHFQTYNGLLNNVCVFLDVNCDGYFTHDELIGLHWGNEQHYDTLALRKFPSIPYGKPLRLRVTSEYSSQIPFASVSQTSQLMFEAEDYGVFVSPNTSIQPEARFKYFHSCNGLQVQFIFTGSGAPDSIRWEFSDSTVSGGWETVHTFPSPDQQSVHLTVYNAYGTDTRYEVLHNPLRPEFYYTTPVVAGVPVTLSTPEYPYANWWWWTFPDEPALVQDAIAVHTYSSPGTYPFSLSMHWNTVVLFSGTTANCQVTATDTMRNVILSVPENNSDESFRLFPNPAVDGELISIRWSLQESADISIRDEYGRLILQEHRMPNHEMQWTFRIEGTGIYFVSVRTESGDSHSFSLILTDR